VILLNIAGSTYCCLAALSMLGALDAENRDDTIHWLVSRQINSPDPGHGGFNGRVNKPDDTCYSFWVGGALDVPPSYNPFNLDPQCVGLYFCRIESELPLYTYSTSPIRWIWKI
jgi:geranylgeranyl transferase type-1 subunit beta